MPNDLHTAIEQAIRILSWQENLATDEMPPRWMWHLDWEIEGHFERVDAARNAKYASNASGSDHQIAEGSEWDENAYASRFKD
jgi:hypothetical protein